MDLSKPTQEPLLAEIEGFLEATGMAPSAFGRKTLSDPNFVRDLRAGRRKPRERTEGYVRRWMKANRPKEAAEECRAAHPLEATQ